MKATVLSVIIFVTVLLAGYALTHLTAPPITQGAHQDNANYLHSWNIREQRIAHGIKTYLVAGAGYTLGFLLWIFLAARKRIAPIPISKCLLYLLIPLAAFLLVTWIKPLAALLPAFDALFGKASLPAFALFFSLISLILHLLAVQPALRHPQPNT